MSEYERKNLLEQIKLLILHEGPTGMTTDRINRQAAEIQEMIRDGELAEELHPVQAKA